MRLNRVSELFAIFQSKTFVGHREGTNSRVRVLNSSHPPTIVRKSGAGSDVTEADTWPRRAGQDDGFRPTVRRATERFGVKRKRRNGQACVSAYVNAWLVACEPSSYPTHVETFQGCAGQPIARD